MSRPRIQKITLGRTLAIISVLILLFFVAGYFHNKTVGKAVLPNGLTRVSILTARGSVELDIEQAKTEFERERGLQFRKVLPKDQGMLFVYAEEVKRNFWMKDMLIALDFLFIDGNLHIVNIERNVQPCEANPCPVLSSKIPVLFVLEVNAGTVDGEFIKEGDPVIIQ
ncbi:DUF192 domain-containing protein [Candidatus Woesearchaeota archaeon]|nr:DUF192 domain-containing protein [Candidatus Woesearchaeota archaeon]